MSKAQPSLQRRLIVQPILLQLTTLLLSFLVLTILLLRVDMGGYYTDEGMTVVVARSIVRDRAGALVLRRTADFEKLRKEAPDVWFVAKDDQGRMLSYGRVPHQYASLYLALGDVSYAHMRDRARDHQLSAVIRREKGPAGTLTIMGHGKVSELSVVTAMVTNIVALPIFALLALGSAIITPLIVRRSLAGVSRIALEAERIDVDRRGIRLTETEVPAEIAPLVRAVNEALSRLDEGYERQRRFIASAAHELRTPIAILQLKIDTADRAIARTLVGDVARLSNLAEQLLDLQRLDNDAPHERLDLAVLVRRVVADLAPLLIAADQTIELVVERLGSVTGNAGAIERVVTNLVQNAVQHGGGHVVVRVQEAGFEVEDDGPGIPPDERERVFEPFHRLRPRQSGTGLGLNLVRQVMDRHRGRVTILDAPTGGTIMRVDFPTT